MTPFYNQFSKSTVNLNDIYLTSNIYLYPYARFAFLELLEKLTIKSIYLPSFICSDILAPINQLGIQYIFYEVDKDLNPILEDIKCDSILSVNYFGFSSDVDVFNKYKKKYDAVFIEDNAHGFLSQDANGLLLGTRGDFGLLSIRKTIFLPNGAALLVNNKKYNNIKFSSNNFKISSEDLQYRKKLVLKKLFIIKYIGICFVLLRRIIRYVRNGSYHPFPDMESEFKLPSNRFITPILKDHNLNIDIDFERKRRQQMFEMIQKWALMFSVKPISNLYDNVIPYEFAFIDNGNYKEFEKYLFLKGFFILPWPNLPAEVSKKKHEFYKDVKVVPFLW